MILKIERGVDFTRKIREIFGIKIIMAEIIIIIEILEIMDPDLEIIMIIEEIIVNIFMIIKIKQEILITKMTMKIQNLIKIIGQINLFRENHRQKKGLFHLVLLFTVFVISSFGCKDTIFP
jgi:hypothetical protein